MIQQLPLEAVVKRTFRASPGRLFRAWTTPGELVHWFKTTQDSTCQCEELDLRVGGRYAFQMSTPGGPRTVFGEYLEIIPDHKLVFTWLWDRMPAEKTSQVTVLFEPTEDGGTLLTLTHTRFPDENMRDQHNEGWGKLLVILSGYVDEA